MMETYQIKKWGNSHGLRLSKQMMEFLGIHADDKVQVKKEEINGKKRLIIEADMSNQELTIEALFENYVSEGHVTCLQDLGPAVGNEKW